VKNEDEAGGRPMKRWMVWLIVGGPLLVYAIGRWMVGAY
jgi:hypothetical protein